MRLHVKEGANGETINKPEQIFKRLRDIGKADQESVWLIGLDAMNKEVFRECIFLGGVNVASVDPKIIFKRLLNSGCCSFILAHNHPSGSLNPSPEDVKLTEQLNQGAKILDLKFLDHLIIGESHFFSMKEAGIL